MSGHRDQHLLHDHVEDVVRSATLAPSVHNTQPWRFRLTGDGLELHADLGRHLPATDPDGRQLHLSCGAALFGARLAVRALDHQVRLTLLPDPAHPTLLARLGVGEHREQTEQEARLLAALPHRHTVRSGFHHRTVDDGLRARLQDVARREGARLHLLEHPGHRRAVAELVAAADRAVRAHPEALRELRAWTPAADEGRYDGIPLWAYAQAPGWREPDGFAVRDFDADRRQGRLHPEIATSPPALTAVLLTVGDQRSDWLRAGSALQAALLTAAADGVQASLHSQPLGLSGLRTLIAEELSHDDLSQVQMLLHLGHADRQGATPRRAPAEVLVRCT